MELERARNGASDFQGVGAPRTLAFAHKKVQPREKKPNTRR